MIQCMSQKTFCHKFVTSFITFKFVPIVYFKRPPTNLLRTVYNVEGGMGREFFCEVVFFSPRPSLQTYEIWNFFISFILFFFLTGKSETNVIKTCALHIDEQLKTCDRGDFVEQRCVMIVVFFVIVLFVTLPFFVHVRTRGRTPSEMVSPSFCIERFFPYFFVEHKTLGYESWNSFGAFQQIWVSINALFYNTIWFELFCKTIFSGCQL